MEEKERFNLIKQRVDREDYLIGWKDKKSELDQKIIKPPYQSSCYDHGQNKEYTKFYRRTYTVADNIIAINNKSHKRDTVSWLIREAFDKYETRETDNDPLEQLNREFDWVK
tara:strand:+ start:336 stop:671 length:336 start_codon:yes stop_codon:yes gene_type:complete